MPDSPWHAHRDRVAEFGHGSALLIGTLGKVARDIVAADADRSRRGVRAGSTGQGGSSTMPHKRNPVGCAVVLAAAIRVPALVSVILTAMVQEHERGLGGWHAEWETLPEICTLTAGALAQMTQILEGLSIDVTRMSENLAATRGLILAEAVAMALGKHIGRLPAHHLLEQACRSAADQKRHLRDVLMEDTQVKAHLFGRRVGSFIRRGQLHRASRDNGGARPSRAFPERLTRASNQSVSPRRRQWQTDHLRSAAQRLLSFRSVLASTTSSPISAATTRHLSRLSPVCKSAANLCHASSYARTR